MYRISWNSDFRVAFNFAKFFFQWHRIQMMLALLAILVTHAAELNDTNGDCAANDTMCQNYSTFPNLSLNLHPQSRPIDGSTIKSCWCDWTQGICDFNCCCDMDCNGAQKSVFELCQNTNNTKVLDIRRRYQHNRLLKQCNEQSISSNDDQCFHWPIYDSNLFCIIKTNLPSHFLVQKSEPFKTFNEAENEKRTNYEITPDVTWKPLTYNFSKRYTLGDPIWIITSKMEIEPLKFNQASITTDCLLKEKVKYLKDVATSCFLHHYEFASGTKFSLDEPYMIGTELYVIAKPQLFNFTTFSKTKKCPKNVCIVPSKYMCTNYNCSIAQNGSAVCPENKKCNTFREIRLEIYHNGTEGIRNLKLFLTPVQQQTTIPILSLTSISFIWGQATSASVPVSVQETPRWSGTPGYAFRSAILIAIRRNNTVSVHPSGRRIMRLPFSGKRKQCFYDEDGKMYTIEFGVHYYSACNLIGNTTISPSISKIDKKRFATHICQQIQTRIFSMWSITLNDTEMVISSFGNGRLEDFGSWQALLWDTWNATQYINATSGHFENDKQIICNNITSHLKLMFYISKVDHIDNGEFDENKILGTTIQLNREKNVALTLAQGYAMYDIQLNHEIRFFDVTGTKILQKVEPPSIRIRLPHDFFYPFIKIGNTASVCSLSIHYLFGLICLIFNMYNKAHFL